MGLTVGVDVEGLITLILRQKGRLGLRDRKVSHGAHVTSFHHVERKDPDEN